MVRELICNDCGQVLGDPIQSNIDNHKATTGHQDIKDRPKILDDGTLASNPGVFPQGDAATPESKKAEDNLKSTVPSKEEQKEIDEISENSTRSYNKKSNR